MKSNEEVIQAFLENKEEENANLYSYGDKLVYCTTTIAQKIDGNMIINGTHYTENILVNIFTPLLTLVKMDKLNHVLINNVPYETKDLTKWLK